MGTRVLIVLACLAVGACERVSLHYCEKNPMDYSHCPAPDGALVQCTGNADCPKNLPVCNVSLGLCVACLADGDCKDPNHAHCDVDNSQCVECTTGADCASGTCLFGGVCQTVDNTAYVDATTGVDNADCSMASPCLKVATGIAIGKPFVHLHGAFLEMGGISIKDNVSITLIGDDGTTYRRMDKGPVIAIGMGGTVGIQDLDISSALPAMCVGIQAKVGTFTFSQLTVHDCTAGPGGGISIGGGQVAISRSKIYGNLYGISVTAGHFDITNNMIVHNGLMGANQAASGVILGAGTTTDRFEFNTVSDNIVHMGGNQFGGLSCPAGFIAPDNIITGNVISGGVNTAATQTSPTCTVTGSLLGVDDSGLNFTNTTTSPYDYHITANSSAIDGAQADANITIDYDGLVRPVGGYDYGADEYGN
ncbi:MAG: hypothetical protein ACM31C_15500 [Acidobacteriota bacterium]